VALLRGADEAPGGAVTGEATLLLLPLPLLLLLLLLVVLVM
jgi:hypothetical protein